MEILKFIGSILMGGILAVIMLFLFMLFLKHTEKEMDKTANDYEKERNPRPWDN